MSKELSRIIDDLTHQKLNRRDFIKRASALGLSMGTIGAILTACGGGTATPAATETGTVAATATAAATETATAAATETATATAAATETATATATQASTTGGANAPVVKEWIFQSIGAYTGSGAWMGGDNQYGLAKAVEQINAAGGIRGIPAKIVEYDTGGFNPDKAVQMFAKAEPGSLFIIGPLASSENLAVAPQAKQAGIPYFGTGSSDWTYIKEAAPWMFTPYASCYDDTAAELANYLKANPAVKSMAMIWNSAEEYCKEVGEKTSAVAKANNVTINEVDVPLDTVDFAPIAAKAVTTNSDAYLMVVYSPAAAQTIKELRKLGVTESSRIVTTAYAFADSFFQAGGQDLDGTYIIDTYNPDYPSDKWKTFLDGYRKDVGGTFPQNTIRFQYDFAWMVKDAIEANNITGDPAKLKEERIAIRDYVYSLNNWQGIACSYTCYPIAGGCPQHAYLFKMNGNTPVLVEGTEIQAPLPDWVQASLGKKVEDLFPSS